MPRQGYYSLTLCFAAAREGCGATLRKHQCFIYLYPFPRTFSDTIDLSALAAFSWRTSSPTALISACDITLSGSALRQRRLSPNRCAMNSSRTDTFMLEVIRFQSKATVWPLTAIVSAMVALSPHTAFARLLFRPTNCVLDAESCSRPQFCDEMVLRLSDSIF